MSFRHALAACLIVSTACAASPEPITSTVLEEPAEPTTTEASTTVAESTTTVFQIREVTPFLADDQTLTLQPEQAYAVDLGLFIVEIVPSGLGWHFDYVGPRGLSVIVPNGGQPVTFALALRANAEPSDVIDQILSDERAGDSTEPVPASVAGLDGVMLEVEVPPPVGPTPIGMPPCIGPTVLEAAYPGGLGFWIQDLVGCATNRVWLVDLGAETLVLYAAPGTSRDDIALELDDVSGVIDAVLAALTFRGLDG